MFSYKTGVFLIRALDFYQIILIIRIVLSWITQDYNGNFFFRFIFQITEPLLGWARRTFTFLRVGMFDFSIIVVFFGLELLKKLLWKIFIA